MPEPSTHKQRGFTLIELVVVIVILGILPAIPLPRFMGLEDKARVATLTSMQGTLLSAATMAFGVWEAAGAGGADRHHSGHCRHGRPDERLSDGRIGAAVAARPPRPPPALRLRAVSRRVTSAPTAANCTFTYNPSAAAGAPPTITAIVTTGC